MLDFTVDDDQKMLVEAIDRFVDGQMRKVYRDADEEGIIPPEVIQAGWDFGLLPTSIPEPYGGLDEYSVVTGALAMEAFAYGDLAITLGIATPGLVALPIMLTGTAEQKARYLPDFCERTPPKVTAALTEPNIQFNPRKLRTEAVVAGDGFVLNGAKSFVPLAQEAETILVYASQNGRTQAFIVERDSPGLELLAQEKLMGVRALPTFGLRLSDCKVAAANKLGGEDGIDFDLILNHSRVALASAAVGVARAGYEYARDYAKNRVQFGEPIAHRQAIAFMLAEMSIDIDSARLLVWETAWQLDQGNDANQETAVMKHYVDDMVLRVADRTVQTLGGYGYIREFPAELWLRNARGFASFDGLAVI